ncbi:hypothetical protein BC834DRAFT_419999 [Gloeopeniophorella convolvens]|nr:hypothetical protein BC834DRAFT_419999 [Gloeopeniophorella convolvens]
MLAQLSTDEARPGTLEEWLESYTSKLSALGIDVDDQGTSEVELSSVNGTVADLVLSTLAAQGWKDNDVVRSVLASFAKDDNQKALDVFNRVAVHDLGYGLTDHTVDGPDETAMFEVQTLTAEDSGDLKIHACWFSLLATGPINDVFSLNIGDGVLAFRYRIRSGTLSRDFADRTSRVISERSAPLYVRNVYDLKL